jgi:iron complex outermembrane receptor protein
MTLIRGPFSALYGNGGGYLRVDGARNRRDADRLHAALGSNGQRRLGFDLDGGDTVRTAIAANRYETDGVRAGSAAQRTLASARADWEASPSGLLSLTALSGSAGSGRSAGAEAQEFADDPNAASPGAGCQHAQVDAPVAVRHATSTNSTSELSGVAAAGRRSIDQLLSVPRAAAAAGQRWHRCPGSRSRGFTALGAAQFVDLGRGQFSAGRSAERGSAWLRNFVGNELGVRGALRRDRAMTAAAATVSAAGSG